MGITHYYANTFTEQEINDRKPDNLYKDKNGNDVFDIIISTYNGINFEDEFLEEVDENGQIELIGGSKVEFDSLKRNGYDILQVWGVDDMGRTVKILSEELA